MKCNQIYYKICNYHYIIYKHFLQKMCFPDTNIGIHLNIVNRSILAYMKYNNQIFFHIYYIFHGILNIHLKQDIHLFYMKNNHWNFILYMSSNFYYIINIYLHRIVMIIYMKDTHYYFLPYKIDNFYNILNIKIRILENFKGSHLV